MIRQLKITIIIGAVLVLLVGCSGTYRAYQKSDVAATAVKSSIEQKTQNQATTQPAIVVKPGVYANTKPIDIGNNPNWFGNNITIRGKNLTLSFLLGRILRNTYATVGYGKGVDSTKTVSINYNGTIKGALDQIAEQVNYGYTTDGNQLTWTAMVTKTFDISFMPGSSDYSVGQGRNSGAQNSNTSISTVQANLHDDQYSSLKGTLSVWKDLTTTLQQLKSKTGTVEVSQATTSVTIHDYPTNVRAIARYIKQLNQRLSRQVLLSVKVLQVNLDQNHQFGIDWGVVGRVISKTLTTQYSFSSAGVSQALNLSGASSVTSLPNFTIGDPHGSNAVMRALGEQGKLSVVTEPTVTTLNNQVAEIRISRDTSYLQSVTQTTGNTAGNISTSLTPGVVTDGFTLYILPKIQGNKVYLQVSSVIATLKSIDKISSQAVESTSTTDDTGAQIQVPTLLEKRFNIRSLIHNRGTLIIGGFKQLQNQNKKEQVFDSTALGGKAASSINSQTIILITATIIENQN